MTAVRSRRKLLASGTTQRSVATTVGLLVAAGLGMELLLPGPLYSGVLVRGLLAGCVNALLATGLVLVWRSARVVNFAQAAMGGAAAYLCYALVQYLNLPFLLVLPIAIVVGGLTGFLIDAIFVQRFFNAPRLVLTVVTIVLARFLGDSRQFVNGIPFLGDARKSHVRSIPSPNDIDQIRLPFAHWTAKAFPYQFGFGAVVTVVLTACALGALAVWLRRSQMGTAVRGVAVNAERAQSLGINVRVVGSLVWTLAGTLAGLAILLRGVNEGFNTAGQFTPELLVPALAAAVLAGMSKIPTAVVAAVGISVVTTAILWSNPNTPVVDPGLLLLMGGVLLVQRRRRSRSQGGETMSWEATKEIRPVPKELSAVPEVRRTKWVLLTVAVAVAALFPFTASSAKTNVASLIFVEALVGLSLIVLTGWAGQISLGQFALVAVAAVVGSNLTMRHGVPFWLAVPLVAALTGGFTVVLGLPALRLRGPFLPVITLAFAVATERTLFHNKSVLHLIPDNINRPRVLFVSFSSERSYYFLCLALLVMATLIVTGMRKSRPGRVLIAARENESGVESFGIPLMRTRLAAFAVSGALCGVAGILFAYHQRAVDPGSYAASVSVDMFIMTMVGGIGTIAGALFGAAYVGMVTVVVPSAALRNVATSGGLLLLLFLSPGGLVALASSARDAALRIVATRRGIAAPSLFADVDYEALLTRRAPLVARIPFRGLDVIPAHRRYAWTSELHGRRRQSKEHVPT